MTVISVCLPPVFSAALLTVQHARSADAAILRGVNASPLEHCGNEQASALLMTVILNAAQQGKCQGSESRYKNLKPQTPEQRAHSDSQTGIEYFPTISFCSRSVSSCFAFPVVSLSHFPSLPYPFVVLPSHILSLFCVFLCLPFRLAPIAAVSLCLQLGDASGAGS